MVKAQKDEVNAVAQVAENPENAVVLPSKTDKIVDGWLQTFHHSAIARDTECWNLLYAKVADLKALLNG